MTSNNSLRPPNSISDIRGKISFAGNDTSSMHERKGVVMCEAFAGYLESIAQNRISNTGSVDTIPENHTREIELRMSDLLRQYVFEVHNLVSRTVQQSPKDRTESVNNIASAIPSYTTETLVGSVRAYMKANNIELSDPAQNILNSVERQIDSQERMLVVQLQEKHLQKEREWTITHTIKNIFRKSLPQKKVISRLMSPRTIEMMPWGEVNLNNIPFANFEPLQVDALIKTRNPHRNVHFQSKYINDCGSSFTEGQIRSIFENPTADDPQGYDAMWQLLNKYTRMKDMRVNILKEIVIGKYASDTSIEATKIKEHLLAYYKDQPIKGLSTDLPSRQIPHRASSRSSRNTNQTFAALS